MAKSPLYTRTGDAGTTSLVDGTRVDKFSPRLEAYGTVDELNSFIGALAAASSALDEADRELLPDIQSTLFDIGSYLATDNVANPELAARMLPASLPDRIKTMEDAIDRLYAAVPPMKTFVLPGGTRAACDAHIARAVARRAERRILALGGVDPTVVAYVNRLSDYFFILARRANAIAGVPDIPWRK